MKALALAAAASLALLAPAAGHAAFPSAHARIVYAAEDLGGLRLSLIDPDSGKITEIGPAQPPRRRVGRARRHDLRAHRDLHLSG